VDRTVSRERHLRALSRWHGTISRFTRMRGRIGRTTMPHVDLLYVGAQFLRLTPMLEPSPINLGDTRAGEQHFWVIVVARDIDAESRPVRLRIDWDGYWEPGDTEMGHHLRITVA
jgi:hypothetical protein